MTDIKTDKLSGVGAVILSAGLSSRMGDFKPLLRLGDTTVVGHLLCSFRAVGVSPAVIVTGYRASELEAHVSAKDVICVRNAAYASSQMFDSAALGFREMLGKCGRFFFTPVDIPLFTPETLLALLSVDAPVVYPVFGGKKGHPVLISSELIPDILRFGEKDGLHGALQHFADCAAFVEVPDEAVLRDADTPAEMDALRKLLCERRKK